MPILGMRTTANFVTNQRPENWRQTILLLYPNRSRLRNAPLTALTSLLKERKVSDPVFHWWEKELNNRRFKITVALGVTAGGAAGSLTVDDTYNSAVSVKQNDVLMIEQTGEIVIVSTDPVSTTAIPILRGANTGGTGLAMNPATAGTNPYAQVVGSAFEEGSNAPTGVSWDPLERNNYTQIFRSSLEMTRTAQQTTLRTGDALKEAKREALEYISVDMERGFFFGKKGSGTVSGKPRRMTSGIIEQIQTVSSSNVVLADAAAGVDMDTWQLYMQDWFTYGSQEKVAFAGNTALRIMQEIVRKNSTMEIEPGINEYGMRVARFYGPFGDLVLIGHPLFTQLGGGTAGGTAFYGPDSMMVILDMEYIEYAYLQDLKYEPDNTQVGVDGVKSGYLAECGIGVNHPKTHFVIKQLVKAKKDA